MIPPPELDYEGCGVTSGLVLSLIAKSDSPHPAQPLKNDPELSEDMTRFHIKKYEHMRVKHTHKHLLFFHNCDA